MRFMRRVRIGAAMMVLGLAMSACAAPESGYRFLATQDAHRSGRTADINLRVLRADGTPVSGVAIEQVQGSIYVSNQKVAPSVLIRQPAEAVRAAEAPGGVYRFTAVLPRTGTWTLDLVARVPGEAEPVLGRAQVHVD
jgi:hypothetical protein